jgi:hypothetical protein
MRCSIRGKTRKKSLATYRAPRPRIAPMDTVTTFVLAALNMLISNVQSDVRDKDIRAPSVVCTTTKITDTEVDAACSYELPDGTRVRVYVMSDSSRVRKTR